MSSRELQVTETLVHLADTLVRDYDVAEMLYYLVDSCTVVLDVDHAGLLLTDTAGDLQVIATTNEATHLIELLQIQNQEGPCLDAFRTGEVVQSGPLDGRIAGERWPVLSDAAHKSGFGAITALPMRLRNQVLGALNLFRTASDEMSSGDISVAQAFADMSTIAMLQARAAHDARGVIDQLQRALDSRVVIEQAKGFVAQHTASTTDHAFTQIRAYARNNNRRLGDVAQEILANQIDIQEVIGSTASGG